MNIGDLQKRIPAEIPCEISDQIQFFLRLFSDQQMRSVISFAGKLNFEKLKRALWFTICSEPVLYCSYDENGKTASWKKHDGTDSGLLIDLIETERDVEAEISEFLTTAIQPFSFPIIRVRVIRKGPKDVLCINMNHTPTDGAGLKQFVKIFASIYTGLCNDQDIDLSDEFGERSLRQVTDNFSMFEKIKFTRNGFRSSRKGRTWSFDWLETGENKRKYIIKKKISHVIFDRIKAYGKLNYATINDIVIAAFLRTFAETNSRNRYASKPVIIPVDLRKYIKQPGKTGICSLTGSVVCNIGSYTGSAFHETLLRVRDEMNRKKADHSEMNRIMQISFLSGLMSYRRLKELLHKVKMPPVPLVTNIGIINPDDCNFNGTIIEDAYITGALCVNDNFCLAYSTFQKEITFSIGFSGGAIQEKKVIDFLNALEAELESIN